MRARSHQPSDPDAVNQPWAKGPERSRALHSLPLALMLLDRAKRGVFAPDVRGYEGSVNALKNPATE
jgi:hypothetical protein